MVVISYKAIREFGEKHPDVLEALTVWFKITKKSNWSQFRDVKQIFNSVDEYDRIDASTIKFKKRCTK